MNAPLKIVKYTLIFFPYWPFNPNSAHSLSSSKPFILLVRMNVLKKICPEKRFRFVSTKLRKYNIKIYSGQSVCVSPKKRGMGLGKELIRYGFT